MQLGTALHVDDAGGQGLPVVFQHGLGGDARQTAEAFPADPLFRRLTLECHGHGGSAATASDAFSIAAFADDVAELVESLGRGPLVVGGISMGAAIALRLAVHRPELVRGLVVARPAWMTQAAPDTMQPYAEVGRLLATLSADAARQAFLASDTASRLAEQAPDNLASLLGFFDRPTPAVTAALLQAIAADGPGISEQQVRAIAVPTLVIGHGRDLVHPLSYATILAGLMPNARLVQIASKARDRARHVADFHTALGGFLKEFL